MPAIPWWLVVFCLVNFAFSWPDLLLLAPAFLSFQDERDKRRAEREKDDEEALVGGLGKKKGPAGGESQLVPHRIATGCNFLSSLTPVQRWV